jgi:MHS family alpha-ketoglutarate permease-like MFS transporter
MKSWGWRIPFLIGGVLGLYALWLRRNLAETTQFKNAHQGEAAGHKESLARGIWQNRRSVLRLGGLQIGGSVTYYTWAVAAPAYAISVKKVDATSALLASVAANVVFMIALVLTGALSDRIGRRPNFLIYSIGFTLLAFPLNALLGSSAWTLFLSMSIALILLAFATSIVPAFFAELLPSSVRTTGIGIPVSIAAALFGGTAPYLQTWFASIGNSNLFIVYMIVTVVIGLIAALLCPETKGKELK